MPDENDTGWEPEECGETLDGWACTREEGHDGYHMGRRGLTVLSWNDCGHSFMTSH